MKTHEITFKELSYILVHAKAILDKHYKDYGLIADKKALAKTKKLLTFICSSSATTYTIIDEKMPF